jgi:hypothetical protein
MSKPIASLSLDLDNRWSYLKTHGDAGWDAFPTYLPLLVPRELRFLEERSLTITFFVVGRDAVREENQDALRSIARAGHEVGNHSFNHEPWLHLYSEAELEAEIARTEEAIERVTGRRPVGFRGPGFSVSATTLRVLGRRGYHYDASTFPTFLGPLARAYYFFSARLSPDEKRQRKLLFGRFRDGFRPLKPYRWAWDGGSLPEVPVTTMPVFKLPIHVSYLLFLSGWAPGLALRYFRAALRLCRWTGTQPSLLLHPPDFLDCDDVQDLAFFPGMHLPRERKLHVVSEVLRLLSDRFRVVTLREHAREAARTSALPVRQPNFFQPNLETVSQGERGPLAPWLRPANPRADAPGAPLGN